jgi:hypothetical protein
MLSGRSKGQTNLDGLLSTGSCPDTAISLESFGLRLVAVRRGRDVLCDHRGSFAMLEKVPLNSNGQVDRSALAVPRTEPPNSVHQQLNQARTPASKEILAGISGQT